MLGVTLWKRRPATHTRLDTVLRNLANLTPIIVVRPTPPYPPNHPPTHPFPTDDPLHSRHLGPLHPARRQDEDRGRPPLGLPILSRLRPFHGGPLHLRHLGHDRRHRLLPSLLQRAEAVRQSGQVSPFSHPPPCVIQQTHSLPTHSPTHPQGTKSKWTKSSPPWASATLWDPAWAALSPSRALPAPR